MKTKLLRGIDAKLTGNRMPTELVFTDISYMEKDADSYDIKYATEYRIGVTLGSTILVDHHLEPKTKTFMIEQSKRVIGRGIANEVYGEVRDKLIQLALQIRKEGRYDSSSIHMVEELLEMIVYD